MEYLTPSLRFGSCAFDDPIPPRLIGGGKIDCIATVIGVKRTVVFGESPGCRFWRKGMYLMTRLFVVPAVMVGILVPTGPAYARSPEHKVGKTDWEQGRPLWSLCEPRSKRTAAAVSLEGQRQGPVAPTADVVPSRNDCEGIDGLPSAGFDTPVRTGGGMSSQFDDDDEEPLCDGGSRCSPVPTERGQTVSGFTFAKAIAPAPSALRHRIDSYKAPPASLGTADDGYPLTLFVPPRPAVS